MKHREKPFLALWALVLGFILNCGNLEAQLPRLDFSYIEGLPGVSRPDDILQDKRGNLWFCYASRGHGLYVFDGSTTRHIAADPTDTTALSDANVSSMYEAPDGKIWLGTINHGVCIYNPATDRFTRIDLLERTGVDINEVRYILPGNDGFLWFATNGALLRYRPSGGDFIVYQSDLQEIPARYKHLENRYQHVAEDPYDSNTLWLGSRLGLLSFNKKEKAFTYHKMPYSGARELGFESNQYMILSFLFPNQDTIICANWGGGMMFFNKATQNWSRYRYPTDDPRFEVYFELAQQSQDAIWFASILGFGIFRISDQTFHFYDSLPTSPRFGQNPNYTGTFKFLNPRDFVVLGMNGGSLCHLEGEKPEREILFPPEVRQIRIGDDLMEPENLRFLETKWHLANDQSDMAFLVSAPRFYQADSVLYRYQLQGHDRSWKMRIGAGFVEYTDLKGGNYTFQYQASLDGVTWLDGPSWSIRKQIPFWQSAELKYVVGSLLLLGGLTGFVFISRARRKRQQLELKYQHLLAESEMTALRAQMNPHFIFNSLNSIKMHVMKQETQVANKYLTRFSHLMRMVLRNSKSKLIPLVDEIKSLELYIEIEKLRFDNGFTSVIEIGEETDPESLYIPPMLVQPYVENAIWHGLMHKKDGEGELRISIMCQSNMLIIRVTDNGVGREKARDIRKGDAYLKKSYGIKITDDRIRLVSQSLHIEASAKIVDLYKASGEAAGTEVIITLPCIGPKRAASIVQPD